MTGSVNPGGGVMVADHPLVTVRLRALLDMLVEVGDRPVWQMLAYPSPVDVITAVPERLWVDTARLAL